MSECILQKASKHGPNLANNMGTLKFGFCEDFGATVCPVNMWEPFCALQDCKLLALWGCTAIANAIAVSTKDPQTLSPIFTCQHMPIYIAMGSLRGFHRFWVRLQLGRLQLPEEFGHCFSCFPSWAERPKYLHCTAAVYLDFRNQGTHWCEPMQSLLPEIYADVVCQCVWLLKP